MHSLSLFAYIQGRSRKHFQRGRGVTFFSDFSWRNFSLFLVEISILVDPKKFQWFPKSEFSSFSSHISNFPLPLFDFSSFSFFPFPFSLYFHDFTFFPISRPNFPGGKSLGDCAVFFFANLWLWISLCTNYNNRYSLHTILKIYIIRKAFSKMRVFFFYRKPKKSTCFNPHQLLF